MKNSGQQFPGIGREFNGVIEIADGSRRRRAAILSEQDYIVLVGDLTDAEMTYLSETGNEHQKPSAYEIGLRYKRRLHREFCDNLTHLADDIGLDRKTVRNYIETASLPIEIIRCFKSPNDVSARAGVKLYKLYQQYEDSMLMTAAKLVKRKTELSTEEIFAKFEAIQPIAEKPTERIFRPGVVAKYKNKSVTFSLKNVSDEIIQKIEKILEQGE